ncbi:hypothetical protein TNCV_929191 [Trichonephila clavipes]|nr:hypothetical protein TNCV_929191 [Trichonephila clavipes]
MPPDRHVSIRGSHEIHHGKGLDSTSVVSHSLEHHVGDSTFRLVSTPILRDNTLGTVRGLSPPSTNLTRGLAARRLFRVLPCHEGSIHLQKHPCLLRDLNPGPTA